MVESLIGDLSPEEKVVVFDAFVVECHRLQSASNNQIISYNIAIEMLQDIAVDEGFFKCPHCGKKGKK